MVEITICWCSQFQCPEADVVQSLVVDTVGFVGVFHKLVNRQGGVVGLDNCVRYLVEERGFISNARTWV